MRLAQITDEKDKRALVVTARGESRLVKGARTTLELAKQAVEAGAPLTSRLSPRAVTTSARLPFSSVIWASLIFPSLGAATRASSAHE